MRRLGGGVRGLVTGLLARASWISLAFAALSALPLAPTRALAGLALSATARCGFTALAALPTAWFALAAG